MRILLLKISFSLMIILAFVAPGMVWGQNQAFTAGQAGTWTVPCGVTSITVHVYGAGGGGGGSNGNNGSGGGGAGGYASSTYTVSGGESFNYSVGFGGVGGTPGNNGSAGGNSFFGSTSATGGNGGEGAGTGNTLPNAGGTGGTGVGDIVTNGSDGSGGNETTGGSGGNANGGPSPGTGGTGGANNGGDGGNGDNYGAGGGGSGKKGNGGTETGGDGAGGYILITWIVTATPLAPIITTPSQTLAACDQDLNLVANDVSPGIGSWSIVSGSGNFADATSPTTTISNLGTGSTVIAWNSDGPGCTNQQTQITITTVGIPSQANAGPDGGGCLTSYTMAAVTPTSGTGSWSLVSGCGAPDLPNSPTATISGLCLGSNVWQWTVINAACPSLSTTDLVEITVSTVGTIANAGPDQAGICWNGSSPGITTLAANTPVVGIGTWSIISNTTGGALSSTSDPTADITGINATGTITLQWTISGAGCAANSDQVTITTINCNGDEPCTALGLAVNAGTCFLSTFNNTGMTVSTGMAEPSCATINGPDMWFRVTVPPSGQVQIGSNTTIDAFDELITVYDGTCSNLNFAGCVNGSGTNAYPITYAGEPGSTIWVRVNEGTGGDAATGNFTVCAYEATTSTISEIMPGTITTVSCGSTLNFYDTGGQGGTTTTNTSQPPPAGNYTNNTGTTWTICPDDPSQYVTINFNEFTLETGFDKMIITSGHNDVVAQWTGNDGQGDVVSAQNPGECLTVYFQSDYSWTAEGWEAVVSCQPTPSPSQISNECQVRNCTGGCGVWVCADGIYNTTAGSGAGIDEINEVTGGCWGAAGEVATSWFYFTTATAGSLAFEFIPSNNGHNINFALYGPSLDGTPPCPLTTGDAPIRCSFTDQGGSPTGLRAGETDKYDGPLGNSFAEPVNVVPGQTYALVVDVYQNGQPPTQTQIDFTGAAGLDCTVLPIELISFEGVNQDNQNLLSWITASQFNNDYFTIERSVDGKNWEVVGTVDGAGTSNHNLFYSLIDTNPYFPVTYYRLKQTDFDGTHKYANTISVSNKKNMDGDFVSNLFPNPSSGYATFSFNGFDTKTPLNVSIVNNMGEVITNVTYTSLFREMPITLITSNLSNGVYQVIFTQGDKKQVQKLSIIK